MSHELAAPIPQAPVEADPGLIVDDAYMLDRFGLGPEETGAVVQYNGHTGTVGAMLLDEACPVGGRIANAYQENGIAGVEKRLGALEEFYGAPIIVLGNKTKNFHAGTAAREEVLTRPEGEAVPDFLEELRLQKVGRS